MRPDHCDRLRQDDGSGGRRASHGARAVSVAAACSPRLDQFADAMHDEGDMRSMSATASRSGDGQGELRVLVLQSGSAARRSRLRGARCAPQAERGAGKADGALGRACIGAHHARLTRTARLLSTIARRVAVVVATIAVAFISVTAVAADSSVDPTPPELRIPAGARPLRYDLQLRVTPGDADVAAEIAIEVELDKPHSLLWLNAVDLVIGSVSVDVPGTAARVAVDRDQFLGIAFEPPLATGRHRVT